MVNPKLEPMAVISPEEVATLGRKCEKSLPCPSSHGSTLSYFTCQLGSRARAVYRTGLGLA